MGFKTKKSQSNVKSCFIRLCKSNTNYTVPITVSELIHVHPNVPNIINADLDSKKWPLQFYRDYVAKNYPVLIKNGCRHFKAVDKWNFDYFM